MALGCAPGPHPPVAPDHSTPLPWKRDGDPRTLTFYINILSSEQGTIVERCAFFDEAVLKRVEGMLAEIRKDFLKILCVR